MECIVYPYTAVVTCITAQDEDIITIVIILYFSTDKSGAVQHIYFLAAHQFKPYIWPVAYILLTDCVSDSSYNLIKCWQLT